MITMDSTGIKVLVIDDSAFMRKVITDLLNSDGNIKVVGTARNGQEGLLKAASLKPDIITLDVEMPVMNGLETLKELMKLRPAPRVIMVSSLTNEGAEATIKALGMGAVDFVAKPNYSVLNFGTEDLRDELIKKIISIGSSKFSDYEVSKLKAAGHAGKVSFGAEQKPSGNLKYIIAIGTSTGGPRALQDVLPYLPADIPAAVLVVQHMPPGFTKSLSARLDNLSRINVKEAEEGDMLTAGWAYIAPGDYHMVLKNTLGGGYMISLNQDPAVSGHRPSVNVMMNSVAECGHRKLIAVMMTGMGNDGSEGMLKIKKAGGRTIAQDESSCVVYGMPKAAVNIGAVDTIVPLQGISDEIIKLMGV